MEHIRDQLSVLEVEDIGSVEVAALMVEHAHFGQAVAREAGRVLFDQTGCLEMEHM